METTQPNFYALILAGGVGSRLWPKSRQNMPKHLLSLHTEMTMIQEAVDNISGLIPADKVFIITNKSHLDEVKRQLPNIKPSHIIAEPKGRNTAWAMGLGARFIEKEDPNAVVINVAADHVIRKRKKFEQVLKTAYKAASSGEYLVTIGIVPEFAHTGFGYIRIGQELEKINGHPVFKVRGFTEKPDMATALAFLATKEYFWNANLYTWHVKAVREALEKYTPEVSSGINKIMDAADSSNYESVLDEVYKKAEDVQIDKGVSEKAKNLVMIPGDFGWSDIGDWAVIHDVKSKSKDETVVLGEDFNHIGIDTTGSLIQTDKRVIATIGLSNMVIIDTPDALLICPKDRVQDVKKIVEHLKKEERTELV